MKKVITIICSLLLLVGCNKTNESLLNNFEKTINNLENYNLVGDLTIINNEDKYNYDVKVTYMKGDYYKVSLVNKDNNHEQIILKNEEGVYVVSPTINKSFKFQSKWPLNGSQSYILSTILKDILDDNERTITTEGNNYILTSKVNYPNNKDLISQTVTVDSNTNLPSSVVVKNKSGIELITLKVIKIDTKTKYEKEFFSLSSNIKEESEINVEETSSIDDIVYPLYLPTGTSYSSEQVVKNETGDRIILTYTGEKPFILIEDNITYNKEHETINVMGEIAEYNGIIGVLSENTLSWSENGREYYIIGDTLSKDELLKVASSTATVALTK